MRALVFGAFCVQRFGRSDSYLGYCLEGDLSIPVFHLTSSIDLIPEVFYRFERVYQSPPSLGLTYAPIVHTIGGHLVFSFDLSSDGTSEPSIEAVLGVGSAYISADANNLIYAGTFPGDEARGWALTPEAQMRIVFVRHPVLFALSGGVALSYWTFADVVSYSPALMIGLTVGLDGR